MRQCMHWLYYEEKPEMDNRLNRSNNHRTIAPWFCFYLLSHSFGRDGKFSFRGERILVNKWSYGLRLPVMSLLSYHRWGERKIRKEDIVVFNNPAAVTEPVIDKREVFISRCIGVPGDTLLVDSIFPSYRPEVPPPPTGKGCMSIHEKKNNCWILSYPSYPSLRMT